MARFSVHCLALYFELNNHKTDTQNKSCKLKTFVEKKQLLSNLTLLSTNAQNEYKYHTVFVLQRAVKTGFLSLTNQLAGFPGPIPFRFAYFCHTFPVNKYL